MFVRRWFFKMIFPLVRRTMSPKLRSRVRVLSNYGELTDEIDAEQLLPEVRLTFIDMAFSDLHSLRNNRDQVSLTAR